LPKRKVRGDSARRLRVLQKHISSAESSVKVASSHLGCLKRSDSEYTKTIDNSLKHLMLTHFSGFREDSIKASNPNS